MNFFDVLRYCNGFPPQWFMCSIAVKKRDFKRDARIGYQDGVEWLMKSTEYWDFLTGARSIVTVENPGCFCLTNDVVPIEYYSIDCIPNHPFEACTPYTQVYEKYKPNDGIVLAESAMDFPGAIYISELSTRSNHFQMRNDQSTRDMLYELYQEGGVPVLDFFALEEL